MNSRKVVIWLIIFTVIGIILVFYNDLHEPPVDVSIVHSEILGQYFFGLDNGIVTSTRIKPNITVLREASALGYYARNNTEIDFVEVATTFAGMTYDENPNVKIIGTLIKPRGDDSIVVVNSESQIATLSDLRGKKVGMDNIALTPTVLLKELLKEVYNINYDEVTYVEIPLSGALGQLDSREVDAVVVYSAYAYFARAQNKYRVLSNVFEETKQLLGDLPIAAVLITNRVDLDSRQEVLFRGLELIQNSFNYGLKNREEISQAMSKQLGIQPETHSISFQNVVPTTIFLNIDDMENILKLLIIAKNQGLIGREITDDIFFDPQKDR